MKYLRIILKTFKSVVRDFTSFGSILVVLFISFLLIGGKLLFPALMGLFIVEVACILIKVVFFKKRPLEEEYKNIIEKVDASSFPSSHVARSTFIYLLLFTLTKNIFFIFLIFIIALTRIIMKKHYFIDALVGFIIGFAIYFMFIKFYFVSYF